MSFTNIQDVTILASFLLLAGAIAYAVRLARKSVQFDMLVKQANQVVHYVEQVYGGQFPNERLYELAAVTLSDFAGSIGSNLTSEQIRVLIEGAVHLMKVELGETEE